MALERPAPTTLPDHEPRSHTPRAPCIVPSEHLLSALTSLLVGLLIHVCLCQTVSSVGLWGCLYSASPPLAGVDSRGIRLRRGRAAGCRGCPPTSVQQVAPQGRTSSVLRFQGSSGRHRRAPSWKSKGPVQQLGCPPYLSVPQSPPQFSCFFELVAPHHGYFLPSSPAGVKGNLKPET